MIQFALFDGDGKAEGGISSECTHSTLWGSAALTKTECPALV